MNDEIEFDPAPEGWVPSTSTGTYSSHAGPFYYREGDVPGVGFIAHPHHANLAKIVHGGALLMLADMALYDIFRRELGMFKGVTVTLNSEFLSAGPIGAFIEATGTPMRIGRGLIFARGEIKARGKLLLSFSGTIKRFDAPNAE